MSLTMPLLTRRPTALASLILLLGSASVLAQEAPQTSSGPTSAGREASANGGASARNLDPVLVTGTRARDRTLADSLIPVDVLSREDVLRAAGPDGTLAAALQALLPSFNFPRQSNSGGADHVRAAQLRGLSPDQVLVLVNGKRRHTSALVNLESKTGKGTNPVDFNTIPLSAVQRIEVVRDGAGAQYGSDAIAGVVNIILDDRRSGGELNTEAGLFHTDFKPTGRTINDGQTQSASVSHGWALGERGFLRAGLEGLHRNATNRSGFDELPPWEDSTPDNLATVGQRNYAAGEPATRQWQAFFNGVLELSTDQQAYAFGTWQQRRSTGAAYYRYPDAWANLKDIYPNGYRPQTTGDNRDLQIAVGLRGAWADWDYDLSLNHGQNDFDYGVRQSLNTSLGDTSPTRFHLGDFGSRLTALNLDLTRSVAVPGLSRPATLAWGVEGREDRFITGAGDAASYAVGPFDGPTGAQAGPGLQPDDATRRSRRVIGAYLDLSADLTRDWQAEAALRHDHYSDFGNATTAKLSTRLALAQGFALRGAVSSNFRAPSLAQRGFSFTVTDRGDGGELSQVRTLPVDSPIARYLGAQDLKAETSRNASIGLTWQPDRHWSATLDAYTIRVKNRITLSQRISGDGLAATLESLFGVPGIDGVNFFTNALDTRTRGADLVTQWTGAGPGGQWRLSWAASFNRTKVRPHADANVGLEELNTLTDASPRQRHILTAQWQGGAWTLLSRVTRHGSTTRVFDFGDGFVPTQTYAPVWQLDVEAQWQATRALSLSVGAVNATDRYPTRSIADIAYYGNFPYDVLSPVGFNGAFYYAKARFTF
ncbi:TonB-dependent receptor plug domain-containing protein [Roseateles amylovorans]|uniref:TonB-dependent receptor n=1 Tax=Roseateles amylovorans TaxID=2978473 RepID=A0ABY6AZC6_9BURK|nr:TonB-dependent receptor [Roseateles amylovorans]UXH76653.1 TonB-dependent receptor [Roseateles amylovorans]